MRSILIVATLLGSTALPDAPWQHPLYLDGGGYWSQRFRVQVTNDTDREILGQAISVIVGKADGHADIAGRRAEAVRVCDSGGVELLFSLVGPAGERIVRGPIPERAELIIPATCGARATADFYVYLANPLAGEVPDFLDAKTSLVNGDLELGSGDAPSGWIHDRPDDQHRSLWVDESPRSGRRCLKTVVSAGAEPTWIATRQSGIQVVSGARYRVTAWVKADGVDGFAGWYLHVGNQEDSMLIAPTLSGGGGTFAWKQVTHEFTAPAGANRLSLGTVLRGTGTAWFDQVALECLSVGEIAARALPIETMNLRVSGQAGPWPDDASQRAVVEVMNFDSQDRPLSTIAVDLWRLEARLRGKLDRDLLVVHHDGQQRKHHLIGDQLLFPAALPAQSVSRFFIACQAGTQTAVTRTQSLDGLDANLVRNPGFEAGDTSLSVWNPTPTADGATYGLDAPGRSDFGSRCAKLVVPAEAPDAWRGWRQDVRVVPGRTYLVSAWVRCQDVVADEVRIHAHRRTADGGMSQFEPYLSVGPGISGSADWTLMSGTVTIPSDTVNLQLHLTMQGSGTLWHDGVCVTEIVPGRITSLEGRGTAADQGIVAWQVPAVVKVFPDDPASCEQTPLEISAARNEQEPLQWAFRSQRDIPAATIQVDPPTGPAGFRLPAPQVNVVGYVPIDHPTNYYQTDAPAWQRKIPRGGAGSDGWPGMWPDPLLPTASLDLSADTTQAAWITFAIGQEAPAGRYSGRLRLVAAGQTLIEQPYTVQVHDFRLPDENHVAAIYDVRLGPTSELWGASFEEFYPQIIRFMKSRRLCPDTIRPEPVFRLVDGRVTADFAEYDRMAKVYFEELSFPYTYTPWDLYLFGWGHPPKPMLGEPPYAGQSPFDSVDRSKLRPEYKARYQEMLRLYWNHMKDRGWEKRVILYISDEPFDSHEHIRTQMKALCEMIHEVDPAIPIYSSTWKHVPDWDGYLDVWGIGHYGRVPVDKMHELQQAGDRLWFTTDGQMCTDTPYCAVERLLPHYCFQYGVEAYEFWGVAWLTYDPFRFGWHRYIHQSSEPGRSTWVRYPNGDGYLLYPGAAIGYQGIVSSIRFEQAREGVEDYEYLYLLRQLTAQAEAAGVDVAAARQALSAASQLVSIPNDGGRYSTKILPDPDRLYEVRQLVAKAIEALRK